MDKEQEYLLSYNLLYKKYTGDPDLTCSEQSNLFLVDDKIFRSSEYKH